MATTSFPRWREDHAAQFVFQIARHVVKEGVACVVVAPRGSLPDGAATPLADTWDGVEIVRFPYFLRRHEGVAYGSGIPANLRAHPFRTLLQAPFFGVGYARAIRRAARGCDLVHAHWVPSALLARWVTRGPIVLTVHGSDINRSPRRGVVGRLVGRALKCVKAVAAVSPQLAEGVVGRGVPQERVHVIPYGVELPDALPARRGDGASLLWVGRMTVEKGLPTLLDAFAMARNRCPDLRLTLVGDGEDRRSVEEQVQRLGLASAVSFEGFQPRDAVRRYYAQADLLVLSSTSEGLPNVVLEGLAHALPIVSTAVGGIPHVIEEGVNGRLVPSRNPAALAEAIVSLASDPARRERMAAAARHTAERFTWESTARAYCRVYERVLDDRVRES